MAREFDATAGESAPEGLPHAPAAEERSATSAPAEAEEPGERALDPFLAQIALVADSDSRRDDESLITLMTLHNAKGLEYPIVFIAGCEDGVFPHSRALDEGGLEEERRLFYVGLTRAMRALYLTYARRRTAFGAQSYGLRSRFLDEIPSELTEVQEDLSAAATPAGTLAGVGTPGATAQPRGGMEGREHHRPGLAVSFRLGEDVVHAAFGDGVVTGGGGRRRDRSALRRGRLRAQADGRVRSGHPTLAIPRVPSPASAVPECRRREHLACPQ